MKKIVKNINLVVVLVIAVIGAMFFMPAKRMRIKQYYRKINSL